MDNQLKDGDKVRFMATGTVLTVLPHKHGGPITRCNILVRIDNDQPIYGVTLCDPNELEVIHRGQ